MKFLFGAFVTCFLYACTSPSKESKAMVPGAKSEATIRQFIDSCAEGDLILRHGNDFLSYQIKLLNDSSKLYSHAGLIIQQNGKKVVAHIAPGEDNADTIQYVPIDSFISPESNIACALYRYDLSSVEKESLTSIVDGYKKSGVRFDRLYDLNTEEKLYCSEMISKALQKVTNNRIMAKTTNIPKNMQKLVAVYFKDQGITPQMVATRKFIALDNLYRMPESSLVLQLNFTDENGR